MLLKNRGSSSKPSVKSREEQLYDKIQELSLDVNTRIREVRSNFENFEFRKRRSTDDDVRIFINFIFCFWLFLCMSV